MEGVDVRRRSNWKNVLVCILATTETTYMQLTLATSVRKENADAPPKEIERKRGMKIYLATKLLKKRHL